MDFATCFENKGEVPVNAFKLLGASSKRSDNSKIGYFGTGLKYAIAVMLKNGIDFKIYSGSKEIKIGTRKTKFLDSVIQVMTVNGEKTSITIDVGVDWKPWYVIREIYSNAIDEDGKILVNVKVEPKDGYTRIFVDTNNETLKDVFENWNAYFSNNRQNIFKNAEGKIFLKLPTKPEFIVFRKGIRVYTTHQHSLFDYDIENIEINESRVAVYGFQVLKQCSQLLASAPLEIIKEYLRSLDKARKYEYVEWDSNFWDYTSTYTFNNAWMTALEDKQVIPADYAGNYEITESCIVLPDKLIKRLKEAFGDGINVAGDNKSSFKIIENVDKSPLQKVLDAYTLIGFDCTIDNIDIVEFNDKDILGQARDSRVLLSQKLFTLIYKHKIASVLLEEIVHIKTNFDDNTRSMQTFLFDTITYLAKEMQKVNENNTRNGRAV